MHVLRRFVTFSGLGVLAFCIDLALLAFLTEIIGLYYLVSAAIAFLLATSAHYITARRFAFRETTRSFHEGYAWFIAIATVNLIVTLVCLNLLVEQLGIYYLIARTLVSMVVGTLNFITNSVLNFKIPLAFHGSKHRRTRRR